MQLTDGTELIFERHNKLPNLKLNPPTHMMSTQDITTRQLNHPTLHNNQLQYQHPRELSENLPI